MLKNKKIDVGIIGKGYWGSIIKKKVENIFNVNFFVGKKMKFKELINKKKPQWIIVATPDNSHYEITLKCLKENINVFCEKPLALTVAEVKYLYNFAKKKNLFLYCNDIENFKNKIQLKNLDLNNTLIRNKNSKVFYNILERLSYHDFTFMYKFLKTKKIKKINITFYSSSKISFNLSYQNMNFFFYYNLSSKKNTYKFNNINLKSKKDYLKELLFLVINKKINFKKNRETSLFATQMIHKIKSKINYYK